MEETLRDPGYLSTPGASKAQEDVIYRQQEEEIELEQLEAIKEEAILLSAELYKSYALSHGQLISRSQRDSSQYYDPSLAYGEISLETLHDIFRRMAIHGFNANFGGKFVDIGSGLGRLVIAGLLLHDFDSCLGIEILSDLCDISKNVSLIFVRFTVQYENTVLPLYSVEY